MPRIFQIILTVILMILFSPLFIIISLALWIQRGIFFSQNRIGQGNKPFKLYKFRTMYAFESVMTPEDLHGTTRITPIGKILRRFSLDELPQIWNVLRGDMDLVGPRPLPMEYLPRMNESNRNRHLVKPGITGWAQVNGRNALSWEEKFGMDLWYVENRSFYLDLKILFLTIPMIFNKKGIDQDEFLTMEEYTGTGSRKL